MTEYEHKRDSPCDQYTIEKQGRHHGLLNDHDCHNHSGDRLGHHKPRAFSLRSSLLHQHFKKTSITDRRHSVAVDVARARDHGYMDRNADSVAHCLFEAIQMAKHDHVGNDELRRHKAKPFKERHHDESHFRRVRSFKTTSKGIVGKEETATREQTDLVTERELLNAHTDIQSTCDNSIIPGVAADTSDDRANHYRVLALGTEGVGKTSIIDQFISSAFLENDTVSMSKTDNRRVTLKVDGEEAVLEFLQAEDFKGDLENLSLDGFLVVFDTTDRRSFERAVEVLKHLQDEVGLHKAVILVGNKTDLVRHRHVTTEEGRHIADKYGYKYIETSAALNLQVDDLLVGMCKQIALKSDHSHTNESPGDVHGQHRTSFHKAKGFLQKVFRIHSNTEKNTENLYVD